VEGKKMALGQFFERTTEGDVMHKMFTNAAKNLQQGKTFAGKDHAAEFHEELKQERLKQAVIQAKKNGRKQR